MLGDLNITMWSPYYRKFMKQTNLKNSRQGFGILPTWPTKNIYSLLPPQLSPLFSIPIDYCLISPEFKVMSIYTINDTGSDHRALIINLT